MNERQIPRARQVQIGLSSFDFGYEVKMIDRETLSAAQPIQFKSVKEGDIIPVAMSAGNDLLQNFMDELWRNGFRPTQVDTRDGLVAAKDAHLADLRTAMVAQHDLVVKMVDKL